MKATITIILFFIIRVSLYAEITADYSIEWLSHKSSIIILATPMSESFEKGPGDVWFTKTEFKICEILKSSGFKDRTITIYSYAYKQNEKSLLSEKYKGSYLLFVCKGENLFKEINGKIVLTENNIFKSVYYPGKEIKKLFTPEFKRLNTFSELLSRTQEQVGTEKSFIRENKNGIIEEKRIEIPYNSEIHKEVWLGSISYLIIPSYKLK